MAISWGSWHTGNSSAGFRVGVEVTVSAVSNTSSSVTITTKWYVGAQYNVNDAMTLTFGGSISGSDTQNLTTGGSGGYKLWATKTYTFNYSTWGSSPGTRTFSASLSGVYNNATPSKSVTVTLPARPYAKPAAPSSVSAVRNSDAQATVTWARNATSGAPYTSLLVQRREFSGSAWGAWVNVGTTSATATSLAVTGLSTNRAYQFQVRSNNSVGSSGFVASPVVLMTPAAPSGVSSGLDASGSTITTTWTGNAYVYAGITYTIQRSVNGAAYTTVATGIPQATLTWTDPAPGGGSNRYRVQAVQATGSLASPVAEGNVVSTIVPPLAPTQLAPNGVPVDFSEDVTLTWKHNHGGDGAAQSSYSIRYSPNGGTSWTQLGTFIGAVPSHVLPAGTLTNDKSYLWQVQTRGITSAGWSVLSASATMTGSSRPTATPTSPEDPVVALPVTVAWDYNQDEGSAQAAWEVRVVRDSDEAVVNQASGSNEAASTEFSGSKLVDGVSYTARVRVRSAAGLWSWWAEAPFTVDLLPPQEILTVAEYDPETGTVVLSLEADETDTEAVPVESVTVERMVEGGEWVTLIEGLEVPTDLLDVAPVTSGTNTYRVTSVSATPTYRQSEPVVVEADPQGWVFVNYGPDYTTLLRFRTEPQVSESAGREQALVQLLGRKKPLALFGEGTTRSVKASGVLLHDPDDDGLDSPPEDWAVAAQEATVVCYRDFTGRRLFGTLSDVSASDVAPGVAQVGFTVTESES